MLIRILLAILLLASQIAVSQAQKPAIKYASRSDTPELQHLYAPYWITQDGWGTDVHLRNNLPNSPLTVTPILHAVSGETVKLDSITIAGNEVTVVNVEQALNNALSKAGTSVSQRYGYLDIQYMAIEGHSLFAPVMLHLMGQPVMFHIDPRPAAPQVVAGIYDGFWWNRHAGLQDALILTNDGDEANPTQLVLTDSMGKQIMRQYNLGPQSMLRISVLDLVRSGGLTGDFGGIEIRPAHPGAFETVHFLYDTTKGFSAMMKIFERVPGADLRKSRAWSRDEGWTLWAPMLALSNPDPGLWFPSGMTLNPYIFVESFAPKPTKARLSLFWRSRTANGKTAPQNIVLTPNTAKKLDVTTMFKDLPVDANWATVSILTDSGPDEVTAVAASYDSTGRYGAQTPFSDQLAGHWEGALWQVDATHNSMITVGNGGRMATKAQLTFRYQTDLGAGTYIIEKHLDTDEQMFIDMSDLVRLQIPDKKGHTFPTSVTRGSYTLRDLDDPGMGNLFEGKVVSDKRSGDATYGCMTCCGHKPPSLMDPPNPLDVGLSDIGYFSVSSRDACTQTYDDMTGYYDTWWSDSTGILLPDFAQGTGVGVGSANLWASGTYPYPWVTEDSPNGCPTQTVQSKGPTNVKVPTSLKVVSVAILPQGNSGDHGCLNGFYGIQLDVKYQVMDGETPPQPIMSSSMTPTEHVVLFDGTIKDNPVGPTNISTTSATTKSDGTFHDAPVGVCGPVPFNTPKTTSQDISVTTSTGTKYLVRHNAYQFSSTNLTNHGTVTNGGDVQATQ